MITQQKRILAGAFIGIAILTAILIPLPKDNLVFTAYVFLLLAVIISAASLWQLSVSGAKNYLTSLAFPLALKGYLVLTILLAIVVVTLDLTGTWHLSPLWYAVINIVITGFTAWKLLAIGAGQTAITRVGDEIKKQTDDWKMLLADTESLLTTVPASMKESVSEVRDVIRYADPISHPDIAKLDESIRTGVIQLKKLVAENNESEVSALCQKIIDNVRDRSDRLKLLK